MKTYKRITASFYNIEDILNHYAKEGYVVIHINEHDGTYAAILEKDENKLDYYEI